MDPNVLFMQSMHRIFREAQITKTEIIGFSTAQASLSFLPETLYPFEQHQRVGEVSYCFIMQKINASSKTRNNSHNSEDEVRELGQK